jgi:hypothetical protein
MFYRISLITNTCITVLFAIIFILSFFSNKINTPEEIIGISICLLIFLILLWFNSICFKVNRSNNDNNLISPALKKTGNVLFVFNLIAAILILVCLLVAVAALIALENPESVRIVWPLYISFIVLYFISGVTAIINGIFFKKALKSNKLLVNDFINDIGQQE